MLTKWVMKTSTAFSSSMTTLSFEDSLNIYMVAHLAEFWTDFALRNHFHIRKGPLMLYVRNLSLFKLMQQTTLLDARQDSEASALDKQHGVMST
jgi:hypothetical protein